MLIEASLSDHSPMEFRIYNSMGMGKAYIIYSRCTFRGGFFASAEQYLMEIPENLTNVNVVQIPAGLPTSELDVTFGEHSPLRRVK